jgi:tetratricopeptide (TPR) repeat protein
MGNFMKHLKLIIAILFLALNSACQAQSADSLFDAAIDKMQIEDYKSAIDLFNKAAKKNPNMVNIYINRANCKYQTEDYRGAIKDYSIMILVDSSDYESYYYRSLCYSSLLNTDSAIIDLKSAEFFSKDDSKPFGALGFVYWQIQQYDSAIGHLNKAIGMNPMDLQARFYRAQSLEEKNKYADAIKDYTYIIQIDPSFPEQQYMIFNNRAICYKKLGDFKKAIDDFNELLRNKPDSFVALSNRGLTKIELKQYAAACDDFVKAKDEENIKKHCGK